MIASFTLITGFLVATGIEYFDYFLFDRHSSAMEVFLKTIGSSLGMVFWIETFRKAKGWRQGAKGSRQKV
jgi:hypothetical protein